MALALVAWLFLGGVVLFAGIWWIDQDKDKHD